MNNSKYSNKILNNIDWDFSSFGNDGLNSIHWYPATFISAIPGSIIPILSNSDDIVLDTFCGTSVTGYESIRLGRKYIGIDNNPIAIMISKAKLLFPDTNSLIEIFKNLSTDTFLIDIQNKIHPNEEELIKWYHPQTYYELKQLLFFISNIEDPILKVCSQAIFSSIVKKTSSQGKHWGWVCDNVKPKKEEIVYKNAYDSFYKSLLNYCNSVDATFEDINNRLEIYERDIIRNRANILCEDTLNVLNNLDEESINLILTSPPYYGVADYVKAQRLSFLWFHKDVISVEGYSFSDFQSLRNKETGARSARHRKTSFEEYISYMKRYTYSCSRVLKEGGYFVLIIGDSKARIQTIELLNTHIQENGFVKEFAFEREIKESKRRLMAKVKNEQILVFKKI